MKKLAVPGHSLVPSTGSPLGALDGDPSLKKGGELWALFGRMLSCIFGAVYFPIRDTAGKKNIDKDLTFLKIRGLLKAFFMLLKHGHLAQDVLTITL